MQELEGRSEQAAERDKSEKQQQQLKSKEDDVDKNPTPPPPHPLWPKQPPTCCAMSGHVQTDLQCHLYIEGVEFTHKPRINKLHQRRMFIINQLRHVRHVFAET